jgi:hypothetical protein
MQSVTEDMTMATEADQALELLADELDGVSADAADELIAAATRALTSYAAISPDGFETLFERRDDELRTLEERLAERLHPTHPDLLAAMLLGAAAGVVSRALFDAASAYGFA